MLKYYTLFNRRAVNILTFSIESVPADLGVITRFYYKRKTAFTTYNAQWYNMSVRALHTVYVIYEL